MSYKEYLSSLVEKDPLVQRECTIPELELHRPDVVLNEAYIKAKTSVQKKKFLASSFSYSPMYLDHQGAIRSQAPSHSSIIPNFKATSATATANANVMTVSASGPASNFRLDRGFAPDASVASRPTHATHALDTGHYIESALTDTGGVSTEGSVIHYSNRDIEHIIALPYYFLDPDLQISLSLTDSDVRQLAMAFAVGDVQKNGTVKADVKVLSHIAGRLGIQTDYASLVELLKRLVESQGRENTESPNYVQKIDALSFKVFATEMSFLKD